MIVFQPAVDQISDLFLLMFAQPPVFVFLCLLFEADMCQHQSHLLMGLVQGHPLKDEFLQEFVYYYHNHIIYHNQVPWYHYSLEVLLCDLLLNMYGWAVLFQQNYRRTLPYLVYVSLVAHRNSVNLYLFLYFCLLQAVVASVAVEWFHLKYLLCSYPICVKGLYQNQI